MNRKTFYTIFICLGLAAGLITACRKTDYRIQTTEDVNIVGYLDKFPDSFSLFRQILERTEYAPFLNAYGAYTLFAPTNSGVQTWLKNNNVASVDAADLDLLKDMVKFHLLTDSIATNSFKDGKLPVPTMYGQYLVTGVSLNSQGASYSVNRQALVTKSNIHVGNGIIHQINNVLVPAKTTIAQQLEAKPEYSIFVEAMKATGFYTLLNTVDPDTTKRWMTVFAETNQAFADSGIASFADLKNRYSQTNNPANPSDSLYMYMAYHILGGVKFLGDIITSPSHQTYQPQEVISVQLINQEVVVNQNEFNGILEKGVILNREKSDNAAANGVWHEARAHYNLKFRKPTAVYWDVSTFPEILRLPAYYKKQSYDWPRQSEADQPLKEITWGWGPLASTNTFTYYYHSSNSIAGSAVNNDANKLPMGLPNRPTWWEMTTPPIVKGKYRIWICYSARKQSSSSNMLCQVSVNGDDLPRTMNFTQPRPSGSDSELEAIGWKRYTVATSSQYAGAMVGVYEFKTTQRQVVRITPLSGTQNENYLDMIHFIPIDEDQILPRFDKDGTPVYN